MRCESEPQGRLGMRATLGKGLALAAGLATLLGTMPAQAGPREAIFSDGTGCYRRVYGGAHLRAHPGQRTVAIELGYRPRPSDRREADSSPVQVYLFSRYRGDTKALAGGHEAHCRADGHATTCSVDGDAGGFSLTAIGNGAVRLRIGDRLTIETDTDFVDMHASDDRTFVLRRLPATACTPIR